MKRALFFITLIVSLFVINNLVRSIFNLWQKQQLVEQAGKELSKEKEENQKLKNELSNVEGQGFIEEQARNKLLLLRPDEQRILIADNLSLATRSGKKSKGEGKEANPDSIGANWKKWWELFFKQ